MSLMYIKNQCDILYDLIINMQLKLMLFDCNNSKNVITGSFSDHITFTNYKPKQ